MCDAIGAALSKARKILGESQPGQTSAATESNPFSKAIRGNLEHNEVKSQRILTQTYHGGIGPFRTLSF